MKRCFVIYKKIIMKNLELFLQLTRLKKPIGFLLLFWPCLWGLTLANDFSNNNFLFIKYVIFFLLGAILMRSAGCVVNDILDRKIDLMHENSMLKRISISRWYSFLNFQEANIFSSRLVITPSNNSKNDITRFFKYPSNQIEVLWNGINLDDFKFRKKNK